MVKLNRSFLIIMAFVSFCGTQVIAEEKSQDETNTLKAGSVCRVKGTIVGTVQKSSDDEILIEVTVDHEPEQAELLLSNLPYVSKLFKNVGKLEKTAVIRVPRSQIDSIAVCGPNQWFARPAGHADEYPLRLPSPQCTETTFQLSPFGLQFAKCAAVEPCCEAAKCSSKCESSCEVARRIKKQKGCVDCQCCESCACNKSSSTAHNTELHDQLVDALVENAHLRARDEAQREITAQKERFIHELIEAKVQLARMQAHLELAGKHQQVAKAAKAPRSYSRPHYHPAPPVVEHLKAENAALKARLAEIEKRLQNQR